MKQRAIAIYSRKSKFTGKGESIENQIELCRQYISAHEGEEAAHSAVVYEDEGFSGGNLERPKFKKMMADAKAGELSAIVVYRLDRISRNIGDFAALIEVFNDMKISFVSIKEQFDTSSPMGRAMMYIASVFSQLERETIAERIRDNMHELAKTGRWLGGVTPTGYASQQVRRVTVDGKVRKACQLSLIPEEAEVVKVIFDQFLQTHSLTKADAFLLQNGYVTKNGKAFTRFAIKGILSNPVYMIADGDAHRYLTGKGVELFSDLAEFDGSHGLMAYSRTLQRPGKTAEIRPMPEWIVCVGKHPGLIPGARWIKAQEVLERNRSKGYRKPRGNVALLSGLLLCGNCGDYMRPKLTSRIDPRGERVYTYLCSRKERSRGHCCGIKNADGSALDRAIAQEVKGLSGDTGALIRQLERGKKALARNPEIEDHEEQMKRLSAELWDTEREIKALVASLAKAVGTPAEGYIMGQIEQLHGKGEGLKDRIRELKELGASRSLSEAELIALGHRLSSFGEMVDAMAVEGRRGVLRACIKRVVWDGEEAHVYLFGAEDGRAGSEPPVNGLPSRPDGA